MQRNFYHRVEVVFPVQTPDHIHYLRDHVLQSYFKDHSRARIMEPDGTYKRLHPKGDNQSTGVQEWLMGNPWKQEG